MTDKILSQFQPLSLCSSSIEKIFVFAGLPPTFYAIGNFSTDLCEAMLADVRKFLVLVGFRQPVMRLQMLLRTDSKIFTTMGRPFPCRIAPSFLWHDFLLLIFILSWSLHSFPSTWKISSISPIHKMGKPIYSLSSFWPISLTFCFSKLFERIILSRLFFFLESNSILSPCQAAFRPGSSILDQILFLSQSISDGFNKPRSRSRTILATIDFTKAFDSVWQPSLSHKLISAGFPPCFANCTQSFQCDGKMRLVLLRSR